jgi:hypothetical protein
MTPAPRAAAGPTDRTILDVTPEFLVSLFSDRLAIQGNKLVAPYLGNWIYVSGPLGNVMGDRLLLVTFAYDLARRFVVYMYFDKSWTDRLAVRQPGQYLTVLGRLTTVSASGLDLEDCELVETAPVPPRDQPSGTTPPG